TSDRRPTDAKVGVENDYCEDLSRMNRRSSVVRFERCAPRLTSDARAASDLAAVGRRSRVARE
ncbi:MAG TPA: hypothetical protein VGR00_03210, partial [Thermoanaerobaculia bacterium]|nr:hypothetical protein [Thermoanaerobaculia bacterium]